MSSTTEFAGSVPRNYDQYLGPLFFEPYALDLLDRLNGTRFDRILELACGSGRATKHLLQLLHDEGELIATDLNPDMLQVAELNVSDIRIKWETVDAQSIPYHSDYFDLVVCQFGVMFFKEKELAFREIYRVIKSGGLFLFNVWDHLQFNAISSITQQVMKEVFPDNAPDFMEKGPYSLYDIKEIRRLLEGAGFQNISILPVSKTARLDSFEQAANGFIDGSPLTGYLMERKAPMEEIKQLITKALASSFPNLESPMQALVCSAVK